MIRRIVPIVPLLAMPIISLALGSPAAAEQTTFKQQILPLDCVFTVINAGTGELQYLTPQQCGVVINPVPGAGHPSQPLSQLQLNGIFQSSGSPSNPGGGSHQTSVSFPPYQPLLKVQPRSAGVSDKEEQSSHFVPGLVIGGALIAAVILLIII